MYKSMGAKQSNWQLSQNNQYVSYALLSWGGSIVSEYFWYYLPDRVRMIGQMDEQIVPLEPEQYMSILT